MRFTFQAVALLLALIFGIVLGIGSAETNIQHIQGNPDAPRAVQITPDGEGRVEIAVLGNVYETDTPVTVKKQEQKQEQGRDEKALPEAEPSWLADAGNSAGEGVRQAARKAVETVVGWIQDSEH